MGGTHLTVTQEFPMISLMCRLPDYQQLIMIMESILKIQSIFNPALVFMIMKNECIGFYPHLDDVPYPSKVNGHG